MEYKSTETAETNQIKSCSILADFLGINDVIKESAVDAAMEDADYLRDLFITKGNMLYLKELLKSPPVPCITHTEQERIQFVKQAIKIFRHMDTRKNYMKKYKTFLYPSDSKCSMAVDLYPEDFREVYLDCNATTPLRPEVRKVLCDYSSGQYGFGNPGTRTGEGMYAEKLVETARENIARALDAKPSEIIFTASGSEANNLAIKGIAFRHFQDKGHLITTMAEHKSVLSAMEFLEHLGFDVTYLPVDCYGMVNPSDFEKEIRPNTILAAIMAANNEIGTINPISEIGKICMDNNVPFMTDAVQAYGKIPISPVREGISLMSISGHKIGAPKGIGALYVKENIRLTPIIHGGGQEQGLRSGTENVGHILAFGTAAILAAEEREKEASRLCGLRDYLLQGIMDIRPQPILNGHPTKRLPNNLNISFPQADSSALQRSLGRIGISVSTGSACSAKISADSHVLKAIHSPLNGYAAIRFGLGRDTVKDDIDYLLKYLKDILNKMQS